MGKSYMEMIYIDGQDQARKTGVGAMMETDEATWQDFRSRKGLAVPIKDARFLLDYYNRRGDLAATIPLSEEGFRAITGEPAKNEADYLETDRAYWSDLRAELASARAAQQAAA